MLRRSRHLFLGLEGFFCWKFKFCVRIHPFFVSTVRIIVIFGLIVWFIGPSGFVGLGVLVVFVPFLAFFIGRMSKRQKQKFLQSDERVQTTNEAISGLY